MKNKFDVIIVGAGHAGTEAAFAAANLGSKVLLLVTNLNCIAMMPCNPSIGGPGKGHLIREIHALGGQIAKHVDESYLQIRELNESRGPAVRALRAQADKVLYHLIVKQAIENHPNITLLQAEATDIIHTNNIVEGVKIITGLSYYTKSVVLATGTFLNGKIIIGDKKNDGGPSNESPTKILAESLINLGVKIHRLQTATPPRIDGASINFNNLRELPGHEHIQTFTGLKPKKNQRSCYLTFTNEKTIKIIQDNLKESPLKLGNITQHGPKHCPSIDRKVINFPDKHLHQIFIEPESNFHNEWYLQGVTTSMPPHIQELIIHSIEGLENAKIVRYGYAIEYDAIRGTQLRKSMELKSVEGLFTCGQINGTSGYEEAAAQGLIAGINAHLKAYNLKPFILKRTSSFIANMMDELVTNERDEPLRVTTSSSEFRLHLRTDNAEERLTHIGYKLGLVKQKQFDLVNKNKEIINNEIKAMHEHKIRPTKEVLNYIENTLKSDSFKKPITYAELLSRNEIHYKNLEYFGYKCVEDPILIRKIEIQLKYQNFLDKLQKKMKYSDQLDDMILNQFSYQKVNGLSNETIIILNKLQAYNIGQISILKSLKPGDLSLIVNNYKQNMKDN
ncbi:MAG: tRNA uridine-5-carboxymethylaminomethyl(34) synthesis enzyme MnmG [Candidatus Cloacimonadota bacterium]|nr:MAG: tRNA uridine-5-carboxymethylaminomethyl(34) synthesis enzyme MnmG [Candidatus Cloacimonadota bacterium]